MNKKQFAELIENTVRKILKEAEPISKEEKAIQKIEDLIDTKDYASFVKKLGDDIKDPKVKELLRYGLQDGMPNDEKIKISRIAVAVKKLKPTQNEIDIAQSLHWSLTHPKDADKYLKGGTIAVAGKDIVTANKGQYIIDGHHRWSSVYMLNPEAKITAQDINNIPNPIGALKAVQLAIATDLNVNSIPKGREGTNLYDIGEAEFKKYVVDNIMDEVINVFKKYFDFQDTDIEKNKIEIAGYLWKNALLLKQNNQPIKNAPERAVMPQTDDTKNWDLRLQKGLVNFKAPFTTESETTAESIMLDKLIDEVINKVLHENKKNINKLVKDFVANIDKNQFFKNIGGVKIIDGMALSNKGDSQIYFEIGSQISKNDEFANFYDSVSPSKQTAIDEKIAYELNKQFKLEW